MEKNFEDTLFYQIGLTEKFLTKLFEQFFKQLNLGLSAKEHLALQIIIQKEGCCCRDLAKIILQDRANTGRLLSNLEKKGFIQIELTTKNNRPIKMLKPTQKGLELAKKATKIISPLIKEVEKDLTQEITNKTIQTLEKLRKSLENNLKIDI